MSKNADGRSAHLMIRKDGVFCTICFELEPVHGGNGTPMPTLLKAYEFVRRRHPPRKHKSPFAARAATEGKR